MDRAKPGKRRASDRRQRQHETRAYGETSLWDAIASTARRLADRRNRRALVVITDGVDSASRLQPSEVSAIASSLDVPVYLLVMAFLTGEEPNDASSRRGPVADLAAWTGGDMLVVRDTATAREAAQRIIAGGLRLGTWDLGFGTGDYNEG